LQSAGSRGAQARQLIIDLESRGKEAFPTFLSILRDTGQAGLADMLMEKCQVLPAPPQLPDLKPEELESRGGKRARSEYFTGQRVGSWDPFSMGSSLCSRGGKVRLDCAMSLQVAASLSICPSQSRLRVKGLRWLPHQPRVSCAPKRQQIKCLFPVGAPFWDGFSFPMQEMVVELQELARRDHSALDCCVVIILSHGCQSSHLQFPGAIYGTDGRLVPVERIVNCFNGSNCPSLRGKPKLFFIQACGGDKRDRGFVVGGESPPEEAPGAPLESDAKPFQAPQGTDDQPDAVACLPTPSDILVSYSTFPGYVSWREASRGSWYVETLVNVLQQCAHAEDLLTMLVKVTNAVAARGIYKQIPGCFNFLRMKFFFMCQ
ncbi:Caspase-9, partial [Dryobates pubescens]